MPNMIVEPQTYLEHANPDIKTVSNNIMMEHIAYENITAQISNERIAKYIPTFDPIKMESEMISFTPRYQQPTASRIIKEIPPDDDEILEFKRIQSGMNRCKTTQGKLRTNLNQKPDLVEFVLNNRAKRLERFVESGQLYRTEIGLPTVNDVSNKESKMSKTSKLNKILQQHRQNKEANNPKLLIKRPKMASQSERVFSKITQYTKPFNASKIAQIVDKIDEKSKNKIFNNCFTGKTARLENGIFEEMGMYT